MDNTHRYEAETERLNSMLDDVKYVLYGDNYETNFKRDEIDYYTAEIKTLNE
jgi:hypothetical protein